MNINKTGGPAFPGAMSGMPTGMTLRDYFAVHAPFSLFEAMTVCGLERSNYANLSPKKRAEVLEVHATLCGEYADAMLAERAL